MRISDWSSVVGSADLEACLAARGGRAQAAIAAALASISTGSSDAIVAARRLLALGYEGAPDSLGTGALDTTNVLADADGRFASRVREPLIAADQQVLGTLVLCRARAVAAQPAQMTILPPSPALAALPIDRPHNPAHPRLATLAFEQTHPP